MVGEPRGQNKSRFIRYIGELAQLRLAVEQNIQDFEEDEQIIYLVDSNVVRLFLSPYQRWKSVSPFRDISDRGNSELGIATAVITAEYIFSKLLAQQKGYPVFVAAEHVEEIIEHFRRNSQRSNEISKRKLEAVPRTSKDRRPLSSSEDLGGLSDDRLRISVERMREQLTQQSYDADELRQLFGSTIPQLISRLDEHDLFPRQHFARLQHEDLIRPLHLAPHIDRRRLEEYPKRELDEWRSTLEVFISQEAGYPGDFESGPRHEHARGDGVPRDQIINRDAAVLTKLFALNDDLIARSVPAKIVFVTDDQKIHYAVAYRRMHERYAGENFLRRPLQFLPMLNFQEMPNIVFKSNLTLELRSVIDSILGVRAEISRGFLQNVIYRFALEIRKGMMSKPEPNLSPWRTALLQAWHNTVESSFDIRSAPHIETGRDHVRGAWDNLAKTAVSLNVELSARRFGQDLGALADILKELKEKDSLGDLANAFEVYQEKQMDVLERQHVEWSLEWLTADPVRRDAGYIPRGPTLLREERFGLRDGTNLKQAVDTLTQGSATDVERSAPHTFEAIQDYEILDLLVITALIAYRNGAWTQARDFAERALDRLRRMLREESGHSPVRIRDNIRELQYLVALCQRFELSDIVSEQYSTRRETDVLRLRFDAAERAHRTALADAEERFDFYDGARANAELGTLYLTAITIEQFHPELRLLRPEEVHRLSIQATECLRRSKSDLETHFSKAIKTSMAVEEQNLAKRLYFKANVNLIGAFALLSLEELYTSKVPGAWMKDALDFVRPQLKEFPPHLEVACNICEWTLLEEGPAKNLSARSIAADCERILSDQQSTLTRLDRDELSRYRNNLLSRQGNAGVGTRR